MTSIEVPARRLEQFCENLRKRLELKRTHRLVHDVTEVQLARHRFRRRWWFLRWLFPELDNEQAEKIARYRKGWRVRLWYDTSRGTEKLATDIRDLARSTDYVVRLSLEDATAIGWKGEHDV